MDTFTLLSIAIRSLGLIPEIVVLIYLLIKLIPKAISKNHYNKYNKLIIYIKYPAYNHQDFLKLFLPFSLCFLASWISFLILC